MIRTLVADDQVLVAQAHAALLARVPGFECIGTVHDGRAVLARVARGDVDLVLLDLSMPAVGGLDVLRTMRSQPSSPDVIVISAARDVDAVRESVRSGAVHYLIKPFTFAALREKLEHYASYRALASREGAVTDQGEIDAALATLRDTGASVLPKGLSRETLTVVRQALRDAPEGAGAQAVADAVGASRVTVRRYLEHLVEIGSVERVPVYGRAGRPELVYRLR
ncbi:response regulator [Miniimonas sp. S16]|uniref:response regulator n=1 Tax=Miniimonas sp. S16 TaxID=2171623 RepID=UPI000D526CB4|nr:response regulator [Miniimonas sp. S16]